MAPWPPITRDDLKAAAGLAGFDTVFPLLIRRLIAETAEGLTELDMPGGSGTAAGGFDGVVVATEQTTFVPAGTSVWELSVQSGAQSKADSDYIKRTAGPNSEDPARITYVQVGLASWTKARTWARERTDKKFWKEVRAYNLDKVHGWLDAAPATTAWLADQLGKALPGVRSAEAWWLDTWLLSTHIPLTADVVLAGRESIASSLVALLSSGQQMITLGGDLRADEVYALIAASLEHAGTAQAEALKTRTLYVSSADSLAQLLRQPQPLVLILHDSALLTDLPIRQPHKVIVLGPRGMDPDVEIPQVDGQVVEQRLLAAGESRERAYSLGVLARRSLSALRRALALHSTLCTPDWAKEPDIVRRRLLLLGGWEGTNPDDRLIVEECVGRSYTEVQEAMLKLASAQGIPFLGRLHEQWHVLAPEDTWALLSPHLTSDDLDALRRISVRVLGETHPLSQQAGDVGASFSGTLRAGLVHTLAMLGASGDAVHLPGGMTGDVLARLIVRELFEQANADRSYALWASLGEVLPLLAEAAPEEFLRAMRVGLEGQRPLHASMFADSNRNKFGQIPPSPHTHFLWALERLAWSPDYFDETLDVLAKLAAIDPGGEWSNRPARSLQEIFSCGHPSTAANEETRHRGLERLLKNKPDVARSLLIDLIPDGHQFQMPHAGPTFRDWKRELHHTRTDLTRSVVFVVDTLFGDLGDGPLPYLALVDKVDKLSPAHRAAFAEKLTSLGASITDDETRARLAEAIREKVAHHREYADTVWALPEDELRVIEEAGKSLQTRSVVPRVAWLFQSDWVTLGDQSKRDDYATHHAAVIERRVEAIEQVLSEGRLTALAELASRVQYPYLVGTALAEHTTELDDDMLGWLNEPSPRRDVALGHLRTRLRQEGTPLRDALLTRSKAHALQATILNATDDPPAAWRKLAELSEEVSEHYWRNFVYYGLGNTFEQVVEAARNLVSVGRYTAALHLISLYSKQSDSVEAAQVAATACEAFLASDLEDPEIQSLSEYDFRHIFALLARYRDALSQQRVAYLEWQMFPALGFEAKAPILHATLLEDPAFFAELVSRIYKPEGEDDSPDRDGPDFEQRRLIATRAYEVLYSWRQCPGIGPDGTVSLDLLRAWVTKARSRLHDVARTRPGDLTIGQALAFAPPDPDGLFPPRAIRDLLEELRLDRIDEGLGIGIYNKRGVTTRGLTDGGAQEWELVARYREQAQAASAWPRTKKLLRELAQSYEAQARCEDEEAERRRRGLYE